MCVDTPIHPSIRASIHPYFEVPCKLCYASPTLNHKWIGSSFSAEATPRYRISCRGGLGEALKPKN